MGRCAKSMKRRFRDEDAARAALNDIKKHPNEVIPVRYYPCNWCGGYHLTKRKDHFGDEPRAIKNKAFKKIYRRWESR